MHFSSFLRRTRSSDCDARNFYEIGLAYFIQKITLENKLKYSEKYECIYIVEWKGSQYGMY